MYLVVYRRKEGVTHNQNKKHANTMLSVLCAEIMKKKTLQKRTTIIIHCKRLLMFSKQFTSLTLRFYFTTIKYCWFFLSPLKKKTKRASCLFCFIPYLGFFICTQFVCVRCVCHCSPHNPRYHFTITSCAMAWRKKRNQTKNMKTEEPTLAIYKKKCKMLFCFVVPLLLSLFFRLVLESNNMVIV